jgi:hypothetical protein
MRRIFVAVIACALLSPTAARAQSEAFVPDPATVVRSGHGYKYPQAGWWVVHIEGGPYERGTQHGALLAEEIAANLRCLALTYSAGSPEDGMRLVRLLVNSLFLRGFDREYLEEMKGIADGAAQAGARFGDRPVDLTDIAALNVWAELSCLEGALDALPTGLEGIRFPQEAGGPPNAAAESHCSAFAATGPATADGRAVIGHITMFGLYPSNFFNVWLDIQPEQGHRVLMQSFPGGIQSSMDYYQNDAGIVLVETTIDQTRFDKNGASLASRVRQAIQYSASIDDVARYLGQPGNGLYTNEWIMADMKTDEIAMYELGTHTSKLYRSGPGGKGAGGKAAEWFGGTEGFYWGCNNAKDLEVRLETAASVNDTPNNVVWHPADRDVAWVKLYEQYKGKMDERFAKVAFTTRPICGSPSLDAKFTTHDLAKGLKSWALFGPPRGMTWEPTFEERKKYPEIRPLVSNAWTVLGAGNPGVGGEMDTKSPAVDLGPVWSLASGKGDKDDHDSGPAHRTAWRGTIFPKADADLWLAAAFADDQRLVSEEQGLAAAEPDKCLCDTDHDKAAASLHATRARYLAAARASGDVALSKTTRRFDSSDWYDIAAGKGVLVLSELRLAMGDDAFIEFMDQFGLEHAGKEVTSAEFASAASRASGRDLSGFFDYWLNKTGMPTLKLKSAEIAGGSAAEETGAVVVNGILAAEGGPLPPAIEATAEWDGGEATQVAAVEPGSGRFSLTCDHRPSRLVVDKYGRSARANGGAASIDSFTREIEKTLIVYGTLEDEAGNRDAAAKLQKWIQQSWYNFLVLIKADREVSESELAGTSLVLIGRPSVNTVTKRAESALPVQFGPRSFSVRGAVYAHPLSGVIAAGVNPWDAARSVTVIAGNDAESTVRAAERFKDAGDGPETVVLLRSGDQQAVVIPPPELTKELPR